MKPLQILLDFEQSEIISEAGSCFVVISKAMTTEWPDVNGRMVLTVVPCSINQANAACRVATGASAERKIKAVKSDTKADAVGNSMRTRRKS